MKSLLKAFALVAILAIPIASFSQISQPLTRAEVRDQLIQIERAGYRPAARDPYYPTDIQAAEARLAQNAGATQASSTDVGGTTEPTSESGAGTATVQGKAIYFGR